MNTLKKGAVQRLTYNRVAVATLVLIVVGTAGYTGAGGEQEDAPKPLVIKDQGGHSFGGTILGDFETASVHCDHGYVEYQIPVNPRQLSMLMVHSASTQNLGEDIRRRRGLQEHLSAPRFLRLHH